jgi:hypothetical protein
MEAAERSHNVLDRTAADCYSQYRNKAKKKGPLRGLTSLKEAGGVPPRPQLCLLNSILKQRKGFVNPLFQFLGHQNLEHVRR